ncbi:MAG: ABC transporter ATP-binding protein [Planctomycetota bacterium]|nr:ABC transporter ATP-binding protein [Planctomycetota bacterium]
MSGKFKILWGLMSGQRLRYAAAIAAMVVSAATAFLPPLIGRWTIDYVISAKELNAPQFVRDLVDRIGGRDLLEHRLWIPALAIVVMAAISGLFMYLKGRWASIASESIARKLRRLLYDHLQHLPCSYHDRAETGDLIQRCSSDVETVRLFLATHVVEVGRGGIMLAVAVPVMLAMNVRMALLAMVLLGPILVFSIVFFIKVKNVFKRMDEAEGAMTAMLQENLTGIRVVRAFARQEFECEKFSEKNAIYRNRWRNLMHIMSWFWSCSDVLSMTQVGIVLMAGGYYIALGEPRGGISIGTFLAFFMFVNMYLWPIRQMGRIMAELGKAMVSIGRISEILNEKREDYGDKGKNVGQQAERAGGEIVFDNVSFFHGDEEVLHDVSLHVEPGSTLAILGPSGSGKSTLINLLLRLYDYRDGAIRLDGRELREMDRKFVRSQIGVVLQEPFLYSRSLRENIKLSRSAAHDEEMVEAASAAGVHDAIVDFDSGYDTVVGERGVTLSGGQQQRVALARAILKKPPILILDDALSSVDTRTENLILQALRRRHGKQTTLIIAHRLSTLMEADNIIVLEDGRITQAGAHQDLLKQPGLYRRLWEKQSYVEEQ